MGESGRLWIVGVAVMVALVAQEGARCVSCLALSLFLRETNPQLAPGCRANGTQRASNSAGRSWPRCRRGQKHRPDACAQTEASCCCQKTRRRRVSFPTPPPTAASRLPSPSPGNDAPSTAPCSPASPCRDQTEGHEKSSPGTKRPSASRNAPLRRGFSRLLGGGRFNENSPIKLNKGVSVCNLSLPLSVFLEVLILALSLFFNESVHGSSSLRRIHVV